MFCIYKIDSNLISNGSRGFIDRTMYNLSKEAISEVDGVISESDKLNLINTYFTTDKVRIVNFLKSIINTTEESKIRLHMRWI